MAAENPVAIINQKGSQPSVSRPAGQPRPACTEFRTGGFLRIRESCLDCHPDNRLKPATNIQFRNCSFHYLATFEDSIRRHCCRCDCRRMAKRRHARFCTRLLITAEQNSPAGRPAIQSRLRLKCYCELKNFSRGAKFRGGSFRKSKLHFSRSKCDNVLRCLARDGNA